MRALRLDAGRVTLDARTPDPTPAAGEALIRPTLLGVSSQDVAMSRGAGPWREFHGVMGSQFVGVVEHVEGATSAEDRAIEGARVVGEVDLVCGECDLCRAGLSAHCRNLRLLGMCGRDGCFADLFTIPARRLTALAPGVSDEQAVFAAPLAAALHAAQRVRLESRAFVSVLGDTTVGLLAAQVMARRNASVRLVGTYEHKLALCERWGVRHRLAGDVGRRADQDVVIECTGTPEGLDLALRLVRPRGVVVLERLSGAPRAGAAEHAVDLSAVVRHEVTLIGSHRGSVREAVGALARGEIDAESLITRRMRLADAPAALAAAAEPEQIKVVMAP